MIDERIILPFVLYTSNHFIAQLVDEIRAKSPLKILNVGGRCGHLSDFLGSNRYHTLHTVPAENEDNNSYINECCINLSFRDVSFDIITFLDMLKHNLLEYLRIAVFDASMTSGELRDYHIRKL